MCWIAICSFDRCKEVLEEQNDRWLDSLWIINLDHQTFIKWVKDTQKQYDTFIDEIESQDGNIIMHHRAASIGKVTLNNAHPFFTPRFWLMQNWTSKDFFKEYKKVYNKETDSETLLHYLDEECDSLEWAQKILDLMTDNLWIIIMIDKSLSKILIFSDGKRESFFDIKDDKLLEFTNYQPWYYEGYTNIGYMILDFDLNILKQEFDAELNTVAFVNPYKYTYIVDDAYYTKWVDNKSSMYNIQNTIDVSSDEGYGRYDTYATLDRKTSAAEELIDLWLETSTANRLMFAWIYNFDDICSLTEMDMLFMKWITKEDIEAVKELLTAFWVPLDFSFNDKKLSHVKEPMKTLWLVKSSDEYFYSEEILNDSTLLYNDIYYFLAAYWWTLDQYVYTNMWIPNTVSLKKTLGKAATKRLKNQYNRASKDFEKSIHEESKQEVIEINRTRVKWDYINKK